MVAMDRARVDASKTSVQPAFASRPTKNVASRRAMQASTCWTSDVGTHGCDTKRRRRNDGVVETKQGNPRKKDVTNRLPSPRTWWDGIHETKNHPSMHRSHVCARPSATTRWMDGWMDVPTYGAWNVAMAGVGAGVGEEKDAHLWTSTTWFPHDAMTATTQRRRRTIACGTSVVPFA